MKTKFNDFWYDIKQYWFFNDIIGKDRVEKVENTIIGNYNDIKNVDNCPWFYYSVFIFPLLWLLSLGFSFYNQYILLLIPSIYFVVFPLLELLDVNDKFSPDPKDYIKLQTDIRYLYVLRLWPIAHFLMIFLSFLCLVYFETTFVFRVLLTLSTGLIIGSFSTNVAHELIHRRNDIDKTLGQILLLSIFYPHFYIEHLFGHHKNIGKYEDNGTSRINESIYAYWYRSITNSYFNTWDIATRTKRKVIMVFYHILLIIYIDKILQWFNLLCLAYILSVSFFSIIFIETIGYIEHYGLTRSNYTKITKYDSWNTYKKLFMYISFRLISHSDHHIDQYRHYPNIRYHDRSPVLPTGYTGCILLALIPPLWYKIMNKKLIELDDMKLKDNSLILNNEIVHYIFDPNYTRINIYKYWNEEQKSVELRLESIYNKYFILNEITNYIEYHNLKININKALLLKTLFNSIIRNMFSFDLNEWDEIQNIFQMINFTNKDKKYIFKRIINTYIESSPHSEDSENNYNKLYNIFYFNNRYFVNNFNYKYNIIKRLIQS